MSDNDILNSRKIDPRTALHASRLPPERADEFSLRVAFHAAAALPLDGTNVLRPDGQPLAGVQAWHIAGSIYTAAVSLNGLKALAADERVNAIEGGWPMKPA